MGGTELKNVGVAASKLDLQSQTPLSICSWLLSTATMIELTTIGVDN